MEGIFHPSPRRPCLWMVNLSDYLSLEDISSSVCFVYSLRHLPRSLAEHKTGDHTWAQMSCSSNGLGPDTICYLMSREGTRMGWLCLNTYDASPRLHISMGKVKAMPKWVQYALEHPTTKLWRTIQVRLYRKLLRGLVLVFNLMFGKELKLTSVGPSSRIETSASTLPTSNAIHVGQRFLSIEDRKALTTLVIAANFNSWL